MGEQPITLSNYLQEVNNNNKQRFFSAIRETRFPKSIIVWAFNVVSVMKVRYAYQGACQNMGVFESNSCPYLQRGCVIFVLYRIHLPLTFDLCCGLSFQTFGLLCEFCVWCRIWFLICFWQGLASSVTQYFVRNPLISVTDLKLSPRLRSDFTLSPLYCFVATPRSISYHCWCTKNQHRKMLYILHPKIFFRT